MTTGKTIVFTLQTFVSKVMSLLLNMLSRFVIAFLLRVFNLMAAVIVHSDFGIDGEIYHVHGLEDSI